MDIKAYRQTRYIAAERHETAFATLVRLYQVRPTFRGLTDFFIIGIIVLPFLGIGSLSISSFGAISSAKNWVVDKTLSLSMSSIVPAASNSPALPRIDEIAIDRSAFASSKPAARRALETAATLHETGDTGQALDTIRGLPRDANVSFMKGLLMLGLSGPGNTRSGQRQLLAAADLGHRQATTFAGILYMFPPPGGDQNYNKAVDLLEIAIVQGDGAAAYMLGRAYVGGWTGISDIARAVELYRKGGELGHPDAAFEYAAALFTGRGVEEDRVEAERWLDKAAGLGSALAGRSLGQLHLIKWGMGTITDPEPGLDYLRTAARHGDTDAMQMLGTYYSKLAERAGKAEPARGADWFDRCAKLGDPNCHYSLAKSYQSGHGRPIDLAAAYAHFTIAEAGYRAKGSTGGIKAAVKAIDGLRDRLDRAGLTRAKALISQQTMAEKHKMLSEKHK